MEGLWSPFTLGLQALRHLHLRRCDRRVQLAGGNVAAAAAAGLFRAWRDLFESVDDLLAKLFFYLLLPFLQC